MNLNRLGDVKIFIDDTLNAMADNLSAQIAGLNGFSCLPPPKKELCRVVMKFLWQDNLSSQKSEAVSNHKKYRPAKVLRSNKDTLLDRGKISHNCKVKEPAGARKSFSNRKERISFDRNSFLHLSLKQADEKIIELITNYKMAQ